MNAKHYLAITAAALCAAAFATPEPDDAAVQAELARYLAGNGDVCLGKFDWPIDVSERDVRFERRDAVQMPVLERLGLVSSTLATAMRHGEDGEAEETVAVKRYTLTSAGRAFYLVRPSHGADLCAGKLSLDKVTGWRVSTPDAAREMIVRYTYRFAPAAWIEDPQARRVFPMVARLIQGEGSMQLEQAFRIVDGHWIAIAPDEVR